MGAPDARAVSALFRATSRDIAVATNPNPACFWSRFLRSDRQNARQLLHSRSDMTLSNKKADHDGLASRRGSS